LFKATRFDLDEVHWLPWAQEWFETRAGYTSPIIGRLTEGGLYLLQVTVDIRRRKKEREEAARRAAARAKSASRKPPPKKK
jgi:hypothetical protein